MHEKQELTEVIGFPLLIGISHKSMIDELTGKQDAIEHVYDNIAAVLATVAQGTQIIHVHDVKATANTLKVWEAVGVSA